MGKKSVDVSEGLYYNIFTMSKYDLAVIGSGPCGYVAAVRAAELGMNVAVYEKERTGGVCLNWGCIPTKALSATALVLTNVQRSAEFGVNVKGYELDFAKVQERKDNVVKKLTAGIEMLFKAKKIELIKATAELGKIDAKNILIATGSLPFKLPGMEFDGGTILSSKDMLNLKAVPKSILIVGGGVIGCEFASIFRTFGADITIVEMMDQLLPAEDTEIARKLEQIFKKRGIKVFTKTRVEKVEKGRAILSNGSAITAEKVLVSVGRVPNSEGLEGVVRDSKGWIKVDENFMTSAEHIYAAGDVIGGILLAHVASREGICAVERMADKKSIINYNVIPNCIFTHPEIASVGLTQKQAKDSRSRKFLFSAIGKAHVLEETEGFIKLIIDNKTDKILGAQMIGPHVTELIAEISTCVQFGLTSEKLASVIHAHPTLSEAIQECASAS
ncbi:dihydrolipoyl dehydrogenase [Candidatus Omnitrophota bacterium]